MSQVNFTVTARLVQAEVPGPEPVNRCDPQVVSSKTDYTVGSGASLSFKAYGGSYHVWIDPWYIILQNYMIPPGTKPIRQIGVHKTVTRRGQTFSWDGYIYMSGTQLGCGWNVGTGSVIVPDDYVPIWAMAGCPHNYVTLTWWSVYETLYEGIAAWVRPARIPCKGPLSPSAMWWFAPGPMFLTLQTVFPVSEVLVELAFERAEGIVGSGIGDVTIVGLGGPGNLTKRYFTLQTFVPLSGKKVTLDIRGHPHVPPLTLMLVTSAYVSLSYAKVWPPVALGTEQGTTIALLGAAAAAVGIAAYAIARRRKK